LVDADYGGVQLPPLFELFVVLLLFIIVGFGG
jgi:hypothetical protein